MMTHRRRYNPPSPATIARKAQAAARFHVAFAAEHPAEWTWLTNNSGSTTSDFARSLIENIGNFGDLTGPQLEAVRRAIVRDAERAQAVAQAPNVSTTLLEEAFARAKAKGLQRPKLRFEGFTASLAGPSSVNAGSIYVTQEQDYYGKITGGRFIKTRNCPDGLEQEIAAAMADPVAAALAYGQRTGACSICGRTLTAKESVERAIGPICAEKYSF